MSHTQHETSPRLGDEGGEGIVKEEKHAECTDSFMDILTLLQTTIFNNGTDFY